jgi:hypothetical protein
MPESRGATVPTTRGVAFLEPPAALQPSIRAAIADAVASIPPGRSGALVSVVTETGVNAAIVARLGEHWDVQAWIGKDWHTAGVTYGARVRTSW